MKNLPVLFAAFASIMGLTTAAHAETRLTGSFYTTGRPIVVDDSAPLPNATVVDAGHLPNPNLTLPAATISRLSVDSGATLTDALPIANAKFQYQLNKIRTTNLPRLAREIGPLYGVDPAAIMSAVLSELTFNNELISLAQDALATVPGEILFSGARFVQSHLNDPAFKGCKVERADYWSWVCVDRLWSQNVIARHFPDKPNYLPKDYVTSFDPGSTNLQEAFRPKTGQTYGPAQTSLTRALMAMDDIKRVTGGKVATYGIDDMSDILRMVISQEGTVHIVAATIARELKAYRQFAKLDISRNIGLQASLFNLGDEVIRSQMLGFSPNHKGQLPKENYFGWFANEHEAEIRSTVK